MALDDILSEFFGEDEDKQEIEEQTENTAAPVKEESAPVEPEEPVMTPPPAAPYGQPEPFVPPTASAGMPASWQSPPQGNPYYRATEQPELPVTPAPKKKNKALIVVAVIAALCVIATFAGLIYSGENNSDAGKSSSSAFENFGKSDNQDAQDDTHDEDATVSVKGSDEAAKKDKSGNLTVAGVAADVKNSCVGITVYTEQNAYSYFYNYGQQHGEDGKVASGEGSGVIMSEANGKTYIMTCAHVIADGSSFTVTLDDDTKYEATFVGADSQTDIGVLSIEATGLQVAEFGDSEDIEVGEDCVAIGCPGGLQFKNSVTKGIVSALAVPIASSIGYSNECIQVDAAINPGNSGGALFNMQGQVIGINSSKIASTNYEGMGFAVPSNTAVETANSLIANGYVSGRAKLGIKYNTLENYTSSQAILKALSDKGFENAQGTMVIQQLDANSNLNGKVQQYDMIVAVNGETMTSVDVLTSILAKSKPGDTVKLTIARINDNQVETFEVDCELVESR